jgi:CBS domain-containing protein
MITVEQLLRDREENNVWTIEPEATVYQALEIMADKHIGALLVMKGEQLVGIFSERDFARSAFRTGKDCHAMHVSELMTTEVIAIKPEFTMEDCMALMTQERIRHLPVMKEGKLVGVVSIGDVVKAVIESQQYTISHLENYILGEGYGQ